MVENVLLLVALVAAVLSVPYSLLSAVFLAGADDTAENALASLLGLLLVPASVLSVVAVIGLVRGEPAAWTTAALLAPAVLAAVAGPFGGPRSWHRAAQPTGDVVTSDGYFRPGEPGYPQPAAPSRARLLTEVARMVGVFLVAPGLVMAAEVVA